MESSIAFYEWEWMNELKVNWVNKFALITWFTSISELLTKIILNKTAKHLKYAVI